VRDAYIGRRSENNIKCVLHDDLVGVISGGRTIQLDIFCHITGFTSDFLSFVVVEHIRFFHGALQLLEISVSLH